MHLIQVGGKMQPFTVSPRVLDLWMKKHKIGFDALGQMTMEQQEDLMWMGFSKGAKNAEEPITRDEFDEAFDSEEGFAMISAFQSYMMELMEKLAPEDQEQEEAENPGN